MTEEYHRSMVFSIHRFIMRLHQISETITNTTFNINRFRFINPIRLRTHAEFTSILQRNENNDWHY